MRLLRSNRSERLVDALAQLVGDGQRDPFAPEWIVVQSKGMERWLSMELARRLSVWCNPAFPFPRHLIERVFDAVLGPAPEGAVAFREEALAWAVAAELPALLAEPELAPLAGYLAGDDDGRQRIELSRRIGRVLDDYTVYRPQWVLSWERGRGDGWEPRLWRALCQRFGAHHQAARAREFLRALERGKPDLSALPERISLFGIASLPPLYVQVLAALSRHLPVTLFALSPCREYWADIGSRQEDRKSHPLLASLGRLGRDFQQVLEETSYEESEHDLYVDPPRDTLLHTLQSDLLNLGPPADDAALVEPALGDGSIALHSCHSALREVEVLHDQLCEMFAQSDLTAREVIVMTPDIDAYAPVIESVFGVAEGRPPIPYSISHHGARAGHAVFEAFFALLSALRGRLAASTVLDLLASEPIRRRFGIVAEESEGIRRLVEESGIRWAQDAAHRESAGQPALPHNTWRFGLLRMLLGYAMEDDGQEGFAGVTPLAGVEGDATELLGKLSDFCETLFAARARLAEPRPFDAWARALGELLASMLHASPQNAHQHQAIVDALHEQAELALASGFVEPLTLESVSAALQRALDRNLPARGFLSHGVTFCQLVPMRSIPFRVVCLIGMNDDAFPDRTPRLGFDRLADRREQRPGDRQRRDDDRYCFLEALLSARERLYLSYVGQSAQDQRAVPPSVVVGELLDAITRVAGSPERAQGLVVKHRVHAFSPRYFSGEDPHLFSYATNFCEGARALLGERRAPAFASALLARPPEPEPEPEPELELSLDDLLAWLRHPLRAFLRRRLLLYLGGEQAPLEDREPIALDSLERWELGTRLLELSLSQASEDALFALLRGSARLPLGGAGEASFRDLMPDVRALAAAVRPYRRGEPLPPLPVRLSLGGVSLSGTLDRLWPEGQLLYTYSRAGRRFELDQWVRHVVLNHELAERPRPSYPTHSITVARGPGNQDACVTSCFAPLEDAKARLASLVSFVRRAHARPLPFTYATSRAYVEALREGADTQAALAAARKRFEGQHGDRDDADVARIYPGFESLIAEQGAEGFRALSEQMLGPLLQARSER